MKIRRYFEMTVKEIASSRSKQMADGRETKRTVIRKISVCLRFDGRILGHGANKGFPVVLGDVLCAV